MRQFRKRYCVFGCDFLVTLGVPLHRFLHSDKHPELFTAWVSAIGKKLIGRKYTTIKEYDHHFDPRDKMETGSHLKRSAIPSVHLTRLQQSPTTFMEADHSYSYPRRQGFQSMDINNLPGPSRVIMDITNLPIYITTIYFRCTSF